MLFRSESLGCIVEQAEPDFASAEIAFRMLWAWNSANTYSERLQQHPDAFKDTLKDEIEEGLRLVESNGDDHGIDLLALASGMRIGARNLRHKIKPEWPKIEIRPRFGL